MLPPPSLPLSSEHLPWHISNWLPQHEHTGRGSSPRERGQVQLQHVKVEASALSAPLFPEQELETEVSNFNSRLVTEQLSNKDSGIENSSSDLTGSEKKPVSSESEGEWCSEGRPLPTGSNHVYSFPPHHTTAAPTPSSQKGTTPVPFFKEFSASPSQGPRENEQRNQYQGPPAETNYNLSFGNRLPTSVLSCSSTSSSLLPSQHNLKQFDSASAGEKSAITMSNITCASGETSVTSGARDGASRQLQLQQTPNAAAVTNNNIGQPQPAKRKRNLPGTPDPDAEVIALSPKTLLATNRFVCEICHKGFQRDQNLQLHRRGHNLPWKLKQRTTNEIRKRVYICPEPTCVHHDPTRALGDLTGIKKHFCRKHGEKKWKCDKCSKKYAVQSDWKAHLKTCGTREYRCDCGTLFSRRDSFITHRAFCDALAEESARVSAHREGCSQQPGSSLTADHLGCPLSFVGSPHSPHGATSPFSGGHDNPLLSSAMFRPGVPNGVSNLAPGEGGIASLTSKWNQSTPLASGPRLSLWLGSEPGTGHRAVSSYLNRSDSGNSFMQHTKDMHGGMGVMGMVGSGDFDITQNPKLLSEMMSSQGGMYSNFQDLHESQQGQNTGIGMPNLGGGMNLMERGTASAGSSFSSSVGLTNSIAGNIPSQHHHSTASAQMSATALLQKAAQMGATSSNPSLLRGFGLGAGTDQGRSGMSNMLSNSLPPFPGMRRPMDVSAGNQGLVYSGGSSSAAGQERTLDNSGMQDFTNSFSGGSCLFGGGGLGDQPSMLSPQMGSGIMSGMMPPSIRQYPHNSVDKSQNSQSNIVRGASQSRGSGQIPSFGGLKKGEDGDRPTLDFLGVGAAGPPGRTLSHRNLASITSFGAGMEVGSFRESMQSVGAGGHSPGRSLESS